MHRARAVVLGARRAAAEACGAGHVRGAGARGVKGGALSACEGSGGGQQGALDQL